MEAECTSYWRSVDAISEESEMIKHLQSLLWSSNDVDLVPGLCSSNVPYSLPGGSPFCINDNENSALVRSPPYVDVETLASTHGEKVGSKRKGETHKENHGVKGHAAPLVSGGLYLFLLSVMLWLLLQLSDGIDPTGTGRLQEIQSQLTELLRKGC